MKLSPIIYGAAVCALLVASVFSSGVSLAQSGAAASPDGKAIFLTKCASCHKANGQGMSGVFPALAGNQNVNAVDATPMLGTIEHGRNTMPSWKGQLSAAEIAAVASYFRSAWGNKAAPVTTADVAAIK
jgi:mono/diheme cytochrome c family protein